MKGNLLYDELELMNHTSQSNPYPTRIHPRMLFQRNQSDSLHQEGKLSERISDQLIEFYYIFDSKIISIKPPLSQLSQYI